MPNGVGAMATGAIAEGRASRIGGGTNEWKGMSASKQKRTVASRAAASRAMIKSAGGEIGQTSWTDAKGKKVKAQVVKSINPRDKARAEANARRRERAVKSGKTYTPLKTRTPVSQQRLRDTINSENAARMAAEKKKAANAKRAANRKKGKKKAG